MPVRPVCNSNAFNSVTLSDNVLDTQQHEHINIHAIARQRQGQRVNGHKLPALDKGMVQITDRSARMSRRG